MVYSRTGAVIIPPRFRLSLSLEFGEPEQAALLLAQFVELIGREPARTFLITGPRLSGKQTAVRCVVDALRKAGGPPVAVLDRKALGVVEGDVTDSKSLIAALRPRSVTTRGEWEQRVHETGAFLAVPNIAEVDAALRARGLGDALRSLVYGNSALTVVASAARLDPEAPGDIRDTVETSVDEWSRTDLEVYWQNRGFPVEELRRRWDLATLPPDATRAGVAVVLSEFIHSGVPLTQGASASRTSFLGLLIDRALPPGTDEDGRCVLMAAAVAEDLPRVAAPEEDLLRLARLFGLKSDSALRPTLERLISQGVIEPTTFSVQTGYIGNTTVRQHG